MKVSWKLLLFCIFGSVLCAACLTAGSPAAQIGAPNSTSLRSIQDANFEDLLASKFRKEHGGASMEKICEGMETQEINLADTVFGDLDGDGRDEAAVMAFSCVAGSSGPDLTAVYKLRPDGKIIELTLETPTQERMFRGLNTDLVSLRLRTIKIEKGTYIEEYTIWGPGRDDARDFTYRWDGHKLALIQVKDVPIQ
jgi:hypothetical protein